MTSFPCPACGGDAVLCICDALPEEDQHRLVDALQYEFRDVDHAVDVAIKNSEARNLLHVAAFEYVLENGSDDVREAIRSAFQKTFGVKADAYGPNGERYFSIETVAQVLGLSVEEAQEKALRWLGPDALNQRDDISMVQ
ncbi:hypothetical protein DVDV_0855 [Desulfovibrio sp. DV]|uniref:hypothetical protein n=1 Tax=Desulfovibrio sp. DV TaxID=1844708 RepID=UPI00094BBD65|nr:hypothetical protein [Desulfovibrio sp. DV]OLN29858.1 hypothetical protein DVDV_0855 [Desulfovibrio sp. DV]